jgi:ElaB/YqjD/DUF883 family membrane-anchored ribosome-binding protein
MADYNKSAGGNEEPTAAESKAAFQETTEEVADQVKGDVAEVKEKVASQAQSLQGRMREGLESSLTQQKDRATDELHHIAQAFRHTADELEGDGVAPYAGHIADYIDNASDYVKGQEVHDLMHAIDDFARHHPILFFGAAAAVGILAARLLKSGGSSEAP